MRIRPSHPRMLPLVVLLAVVMAQPSCLLRRERRDESEERVRDLGPGDHQLETSVDGRARTWTLHVPSSVRVDGGEGLTLVVVLHGGGGTGEQMEFAGFDEISDEEGFVVAYPDAYRRNWNDGRSDLQAASVTEEVDDVAFLERVIAETSNGLDSEPANVYVAGISNGAMMSGRVACDLSDVVDGVAMVAGSLGAEQATRCTPERAVSVLDISGTEDPLVPWGGGDVTVLGRKRGSVLGVEQTVRFWSEANGCAPLPVEESVEDSDLSDASTVTTTVFSGCADGTAVALVEVDGGGHTWPGRPFRLPDSAVGTTNMDVDATQYIWSFFDSHPRS